MKFLNGNRVYVQGVDVAFFIKYSIPTGAIVPTPILRELAGDEDDISMPNEYEMMNFDYYFEYPECVQWLMAQDWIVDYPIFDTRTDTEDLESSINIASFYANNRSFWFAEQNEYWRVSPEGVAFQCDLIRETHRIEDMRNLMLYKRGELAICLPPELGHPVYS